MCRNSKFMRSVLQFCDSLSIASQQFSMLATKTIDYSLLSIVYLSLLLTSSVGFFTLAITQ